MTPADPDRFRERVRARVADMKDEDARVPLRSHAEMRRIHEALGKDIDALGRWRERMAKVFQR